MPTCSKLEDVGFGAVGSSLAHPHSEIIYSTGEAVEGECVQFRLLYSGRLLGASRSDTRAALKHKIRLEFHPQLKRLWETNASLANYARTYLPRWLERHPEDKAVFNGSMEHRERYGLLYLAEKWSRARVGFIPLVTEDLCFRCSLDILFLRPEEGRMVIHGGDLDNRVKILFDSLRVPKNADELGAESAQNGAEPIYCLLEDDSLISEVRVNADQLLLLPHEDEINANDVFLVIDVKMQPHASWSMYFS
jgi:hypothetical protein